MELITYGSRGLCSDTCLYVTSISVLRLTWKSEVPECVWSLSNFVVQLASVEAAKSKQDGGLSVVLQGSRKENDRAWDQFCLIQAFISLQSSKVPFLTLASLLHLSLSVYLFICATSRQKLVMAWACKNPADFLLLFQILSLEAYFSTKPRETLVNCYQLS